MRSWTYSYKTSDGLRHEAEMSAPTKDDVYAALRERGIRAIRVDERIAPVVRRGFQGLRKRDWLLLASIGVCLLVMAVFLFLRPTLDSQRSTPGSQTSTLNPQRPTQSPSVASPELQALGRKVESALTEFRQSFAKVDGELLCNYALLERLADAREFRAEIAKGRAAVSNGQDLVRAVFRSSYGTIPSTDADARESAQRLYGAAMDEIDGASESLDRDECAVDFLLANRGRWKVVRGRVECATPELTRQFSFFRRERLPSAETRWQKDFSH